MSSATQAESVVMELTMSSASMPPTWRPLIHEAGLSAKALRVGLTALRKANFDDHWNYYQGFFGVTIGLERLLKLVILIESVNETGCFPTVKVLKQEIGHDLVDLIQKSRVVAVRLDGELQWPVPSGPLIETAVTILAGFAKGDRYFNLDFLAGAQGSHDPVSRWFTEVGETLIKQQPPRATTKRQRNAKSLGKIDSKLGASALVRYETETGQDIRSFREASLAMTDSAYVAKEGTFLCISIARSAAEILQVCTWRAMRLKRREIPPGLYEAFAFLMNDDQYLKGRKSFER